MSKELREETLEFLREHSAWLGRLEQLRLASNNWERDNDDGAHPAFLEASKLLFKWIVETTDPFDFLIAEIQEMMKNE